MFKVENGKVYNALGEVALLISPNFGGGWDHDRYLPEVVLAVAAGQTRAEVAALVSSLFPEEYSRWPYRDELVVEWVTPGQKYRITEYDGAENIQFPDDLVWQTA